MAFKDMTRVTHTIDPFIFKEARVLILGTMPSPKSREQGFYYGHPQNRFWKVLAAVFEEAEPVSVNERKDFLLRHGIALWDVLCSCDISGASDSSILNPVPNDILGAIAGTDIKAVFTTGKTARKLLKKLVGKEGILLPSPSPANCAKSIEALIEEYSEIKSYLK